jgi:hypothetical protein
VRGLQRLIALEYDRDPRRGTRGKPGGFLLIWPAMGLDARISAPWFHSVYHRTCRIVAGLAACSTSLPRKSKHGHTWPPPRARVDTVQNRSEFLIAAEPMCQQPRRGGALAPQSFGLT